MVVGFAPVALCVRAVGCRSAATGDEVTGPMPGDDVVARPQRASTRAITIDVPPARVWPLEWSETRPLGAPTTG